MKPHRNKDLNDLPNEIWKPVEGYETIFHISNMGRLKRLGGFAISNRTFKHAGRTQTKIPIKEKILVGTYNRKKYVRCKVSYNIDLDPSSRKRAKSFLIHRLVAGAFIPNPNNHPQVNHINGINDDNRVENLEWCSNDYNQYHRYEILGRDKEIIATNKKRVVKVHMLDDMGNIIRTYDSIKQAAKENGTSTSNICKVDRGVRPRAGGYAWEVDKLSRRNRYRVDNPEKN